MSKIVDEDKMQYMKISIVIPIFNVEDYIAACIHSVMNQDYMGEIECLLIDDCGTDKSIQLVEECISTNIKQNIQFRIIHHQRNRGLSVARNTGINAATGDYVYFLDSDDTIAPESIRLMTEPLLKTKYDFVIANYRITGSNTIAPLLGLREGEHTGNEAIFNSYHTQWFVMAWNKLISLKLLRENNLYFKEGLIREDELWSFQLACIASSMYVIHNNTYNYRLCEDSIMTGDKAIDRIQAMVMVLEGWVQIAKSYNVPYARNHLYYLLEMEKRNNYIESLSCMNLNQRIELYKELRTLRLTSPDNINFINIALIRLRDLHTTSIIPSFIGFVHMEFLARMISFIRKKKS